MSAHLYDVHGRYIGCLICGSTDEPCRCREDRRKRKPYGYRIRQERERRLKKAQKDVR